MKIALDKIVAAVCKKMLPLTERSTRGARTEMMMDEIISWKARVDTPVAPWRSGKQHGGAISRLRGSATCRRKSNTFRKACQHLLTALPFFGKLEVPNQERRGQCLIPSPKGEKVGFFRFCQKNIHNWISSYRRRRRSGIREDRRLFLGRGVCASAFFVFSALQTQNQEGGIHA